MKKKDTKWMVVLLVAVILLLGVACYLHLDCRNLEVLLAEGKGTEAETMQVLSRMTLEPSLSLESQLEESRTELAESEAERQRLEQEVADLEDTRKGLQEANIISMSELEELSPDEYAKFAAELKEVYAGLREGEHVQCHRAALKVLEDAGLLRMKPFERQMCEEYLSSYQEYVNGVLDGIWSEEEAEERFRQLEKMYKEGYGRFFVENLAQIYVKSLGVATWEEAEREMQFPHTLACEFAMTRVWFYSRVLQNRLAREMLERDCPPLDYGLAPDETDAEVRQLEEWMSYRRERP